MHVTRTSPLTDETNTLFIAGLTQDMLDSWHNGALIQEALAGIPQGLREFIMTGITPDEWDERIGDEPDEDWTDCWDVTDEPLDADYVAAMINFENK